MDISDGDNNEFSSNEEAAQFIKEVSTDLMLLMYEDLTKDLQTFKTNCYKNIALELNRTSALVWVFVNDEGIHNIFTFDNVCKRLGYKTTEIRQQLLQLMTDYEKERFLKYQPDLKGD